MRLDQALVVRGACESRNEAQELIEKGVVLINQVICTKKAKQVTDDDYVTIKSSRMFVSRGGEKLEGALRQVFGDAETVSEMLKGKRALDVGSSTGGFTHCLLSHGIGSVDAVDVGTDQLHPAIRKDPRVRVFEKTDIRDFEYKKAYDFIVGDLSFIPLEKVLDAILKATKKGSHLLLLVKPQFEVGKGHTKKGIVKNDILVIEILKKYSNELIALSCKEVTVFPSVIKGGEGNQEYFLYCVQA